MVIRQYVAESGGGSVEQEPGVVDQAAGDLRVVVVDGLEAGHDDLEENEPDSALLADGDHALVVYEHDHLCRRAERIRHTITGNRLVCCHPSVLDRQILLGSAIGPGVG